MSEYDDLYYPQRSEKGIIFFCPKTDQLIEIEESALREDIRKAVKDGLRVWINDYISYDDGHAEFEFKVNYPN